MEWAAVKDADQLLANGLLVGFAPAIGRNSRHAPTPRTLKRHRALRRWGGSILQPTRHGLPSSPELRRRKGYRMGGISRSKAIALESGGEGLYEKNRVKGWSLLACRCRRVDGCLRGPVSRRPLGGKGPVARDVAAQKRQKIFGGNARARYG